MAPPQIINFNGTEERDIIGGGPATESIGLSLSVCMGIQCTERFRSRSKEVDFSLDFEVGYKGNTNPPRVGFVIAIYTGTIL